MAAHMVSRRRKSRATWTVADSEQCEICSAEGHQAAVPLPGLLDLDWDIGECLPEGVGPNPGQMKQTGLGDVRDVRS